MTELSLDAVKEAFAGFGKNVLKIRKYIRDNQASLQAHSTTMLNRTVKDYLPAGMQLKRNYGHLALRSVGKAGRVDPDEEPQPKPKPERKKKMVEVEYEYEYEEDDTPPQRGPPQSYYEQPINYNMMSNADLARQCFMPALSRYRRQWG